MDLVEEVKARLNIEDVIGEYVELKRAGRNWRGLSPFKHEKTPSFIVSPEKQIWHDFSSGKGGNLISFVMDAEGLEFKDALELLARKAGLDPAQFKRGGRPSGPSKDRLYDLLAASGRFYQVQFSKNVAALNYVLKKRAFSKETALAWQLGYAPNSSSALSDWLMKQGYSSSECKQAGVASVSYRGELVDMFRGRLMIPLCDPFGRIIGFTARILVDDPKAPKYINTPQTSLYDKSRHIFGLHLAKETIRKEGYSLLMEGNLDVIASHQAGVTSAVATAGTALTTWQLRDLARFSPDVRLCFDTDSAGQAAAERALTLAAQTNAALSMIELGKYKDPDELIKQEPASWSKLVTKPKYGMDWLIERYEREFDLESALGKKKFSDIVLPHVLALSDPVEQDHYLNQMAKLLSVEVSSLRAKGQKAAPPPRRRKSVKEPATNSPAALEYQKLQDNLLSLMTKQPDLRDLAALVSANMLSSPPAQKLLRELKAQPKVTLNRLEKLPGSGEYVKILVVLFEELYQGLESMELRLEAERLRARLIEQFVKTEKTKLGAALERADQKQSKSLLESAHRLDVLLSKVKGV